jgi:6-pyruvoyltetrahydropterin/6-carboxytetrahydropterin synthase
MSLNKVSVSRKEHFNAAHRLAKAEWGAEKNFAVFGKCSLPNYHGHNYEVIVTVTGNPDPDTGYVIDMKWLSDLVKTNISNRFDHKNLNLDVPEFKSLNPTAENIVIVIWNILRPLIAPALHLKIKLYETERNFVEYPSE